jgi:parvulin-like peptidyl-prolyl isomerase
MHATLVSARLTLGIVLGAFSVAAVWAQEAAKPSTAPQPPVAATINGDPIYVGEVEAMASVLARTAPYLKQSPAYVRADSLKQLVNRRLGELHLRRLGEFINDDDVKKAISKLEEQASARNVSLEQYAAGRGVGLSALRHDNAWDLGWNKYLEQHLSRAMKEHFDKNHQEYDGTLVRVSHILLRPDVPTDSYPKLTAKAEKLREEIESGKLTFPQAAEKYSAGPSRASGGDLGYFPRHGVMHESFSQAAFKLDKGKISTPVVTPFGVHLIQATDFKPGTRQWTESIEEIKPKATLELFEKIADEERGAATIEYTGKVPYFKPGTEEIVDPNGTAAPPATRSSPQPAGS